MKTITDRLIDRMEGVEDIEVVELGNASEETRGGWTGPIFDGTTGFKLHY